MRKTGIIIFLLSISMLSTFAQGKIYATICNKSEGELTLSMILQNPILAIKSDSILVKVTSYDLHLMTNDTVYSFKQNTDSMSTEGIEQINKLKSGDKIACDRIIVLDSYSNKRMLNAIVFEIK
ncbi:hypothetical protein ACFLQ5_02270 [Bacteroidota bacterium]